MSIQIEPSILIHVAGFKGHMYTQENPFVFVP